MYGILNTEEFENIISKIEMYNKELNLDFSNFKSEIRGLIDHYNTNNAKYIHENSISLEKDFDRIIDNNNKNIMILSRTLAAYNKIDIDIINKLEELR